MRPTTRISQQRIKQLTLKTSYVQPGSYPLQPNWIKLNSMKRQITFVYIFFLLTLTACNSNKNNISKNYKTLEFKSWITDTVPILKSHLSMEHEIIIGTDSLSLELKKCYNFNWSMPDSIKKDNEVQKVLYLLKKYDEYPTDKFEISFNTMDYFYPSQVDQLRFEEVFEIQNLRVISTKDTSTYQYIRGRLSGKKVIAKDCENVEFNFIWDNNELKKIRLK